MALEKPGKLWNFFSYFVATLSFVLALCFCMHCERFNRKVADVSHWCIQ